mmetsp:Transcript_87620/g.233298  ORF Transcript_87620/g.233298 Transcript_87620/m.233298 type:complete len:114 (-) Transcript_87620:69-410(-)
MQTALHHAAREGDLELVQDLVDGTNGHYRIELDVRDMCGRTPLHLAVMWGRFKVVQFFVEAGANVEARDDTGRTPLDLANEEKIRQALGRPSLKIEKAVEAQEWRRFEDAREI